MKYVLRKADLSDEIESEISKETYEAYKESGTILSNCLEFEEKYEILILTYLDFERKIFDATTMHIVHGLFLDPLETFDIRLALNISLMSLLTSARLYVDQFCHLVGKCVPHLDDVEKLAKSILSKEYDQSPEYRFMEQFRNHVQHYGLPIHWISSGMRWTDLSEDGLLEYSMDFGAQKSFLEEDKKFKKSIINESPCEVDLKSMTRCYLESLSKAHDAARDLIKESVQNARQNFEDAYSHYRKICPDHSGSLSACIIDDQGIIETIPLMLYLDDIRVKLQKRNRKLVNLKKSYVTGKAKAS